MSVATNVIPIGGTRTIEVDRLPAERRRVLLTWLARHKLEIPPEATETLVTAWARAGHELDYRFTEFCERQAIADAADYGPLDWDWACPSCGHPLAGDCGCRCCPTAHQYAHDSAREALDVLIGSAR